MRYLIAYLLSLFVITVQAEGEVPFVDLETNMGKIVLELDPKNAPKSVENFLSYANEGFYEGTVFHRVISRFMIQGGGFTESYEKKPTRDPVVNEANNGLENLRGTVAMARTNKPHSANSQFFINVNDNTFLNHRSESRNGWGYAVFGKVVEGMDVVDKIKDVEVGAAGPFKRNVPLSPVVIKKVTVRMATPTPVEEIVPPPPPPVSKTDSGETTSSETTDSEEDLEGDSGGDEEYTDDEEGNAGDEEGDAGDEEGDSGDEENASDEEYTDEEGDAGDDSDLADNEGDDEEYADEEGDSGDDSDLADEEGDSADDSDMADTEEEKVVDSTEKTASSAVPPTPVKKAEIPVKTTTSVKSELEKAPAKVETPPTKTEVAPEPEIKKGAVVPEEKKAKAISAPDRPSKADKPESPAL